jgi:hypothetical protein
VSRENLASLVNFHPVVIRIEKFPIRRSSATAKSRGARVAYESILLAWRRSSPIVFRRALSHAIPIPVFSLIWRIKSVGENSCPAKTMFFSSIASVPSKSAPNLVIISSSVTSGILNVVNELGASLALNCRCVQGLVDCF